MWQRYNNRYCAPAGLGLSIDISRMNFPDDFFDRMSPEIASAFGRMRELEGGAVSNPDENRQVGHYWLRAPELAPDEDITRAIRAMWSDVKSFAEEIHAGRVLSERRERFTRLLVIGIGGSALGPQLAADALGTHEDPMSVDFCDNTDPDGIDRTIGRIGADLSSTLCLVISKSGGTPEPRNSALEVAAAFGRAGLDFARAAVAVTGEGSALYQKAAAENWIRIFPMWDWVGGRTSQLAAVGLLPAALQGIDIDEFIAGARDMDEATRLPDARRNPAALLALMWHYAGDGRGARDMVVLPYKDRLALFGRYLQQLVMESLGKEKDLDGKVVHQGLAVYGNKGSTDQHAYVQQLREGVNNFFAVFIEVLRDRTGVSIETEPGVTSGDYLNGFFQGTRTALTDNGRESLTITLEEVTPRSLGMLIALFERAVGLYAFMISINAYHQPGVEAGKKAAADILRLQGAVLDYIRSRTEGETADEIAAAVGAPDKAESVWMILRHLAANDRGIIRRTGARPDQDRFLAG